MLLKDAGIKHPLVCVFVGTVFGTCAMLHEINASLFSLLTLLFLVSFKRLPHILVGMAIGVLAVILSLKPAGYEGEHRVSGRILSSGFEYGTYRVELKNVRIDGKPVRGKTRLSVYESIGKPAGREVEAIAKLSFPDGPDNFSQTDIRHSLLADGTTITGHIADFRDIKFSGKMPSVRLVSEMLNSVGSNEAGVLKAVITGDRSGLTPQVNDLFSSLGLTHLIAISGLNFGLVILFGYLMIFNVIRVIPPLAQRLDTPLVSKTAGLVCAIAYGAFVEPSFPTTRALIMACIVVGAFMTARRVNLIDALAFSGIFILAFWPHSLFTASFLLSFAAVLGIVAVTDRLAGKGAAVQLIAIPFIAAVFTMPVSVYYFGFVSPFGVIYNLIFVPVFSFVIMPLSMAGMLLAGIWKAGAFYLFGLCMNAISIIFMAGERFGCLVPVPKPGIWYVYLWFIVLFIALFAKRSFLKKILLAATCILLIALPVYQHHQRIREPLAFDFIDVGHGDCILITKGNRAVLVDAGGSYTGFDTGRFIVGPRLLSRGVTKLDLVVATHSHPDHIGGLPFILNRFKVGQLWVNYKKDAGFMDVFLVTKMKRIPVMDVKAGDGVTFDNGLNLKVFHPQVGLDNPGHRLDLNLHSIILAAGDERLSGIFMADSDMFGEVNMVHMGKNIKTDVLKAAHHGSRNSCLDIFLDAVKPEVAVITCGSGGRFSMPSDEALARLEAGNTDIMRTDLDGEIIITKKNNSLVIKSFRNRAEKNFRTVWGDLLRGDIRR